MRVTACESLCKTSIAPESRYLFTASTWQIGGTARTIGRQVGGEMSAGENATLLLVDDRRPTHSPKTTQHPLRHLPAMFEISIEPLIKLPLTLQVNTMVIFAYFYYM